ncbi:MAG: O-antigen ligase family protein [Lentimonas sp.]
MKSGPNHRRHPKAYKIKKKSPRLDKSRKKSDRIPMTSSFKPLPIPNRNAVLLNSKAKEKPVWLGCLVGILAIFVLCIGGHPGALSTHIFAVMLVGLALLIRPPKEGCGKAIDRGMLALVAVIASAFVPPFYWSTPSWKEEARFLHNLELPFSLTPHPLISFESFLLILAAIGWFYAACGWKLNANGRRYLMCALSFIVSAFAGFILWRYSYTHSGTVDPTEQFSFLEDSAQVGALLSISGILSFAYMAEGLRMRDLMHFSGILCTSLCLIALLVGGYSIGLLIYVFGIILWFIIRVSSKAIPRSFKVIFPCVLAVLTSYLIFEESAIDWVVDGFAYDAPSTALTRVGVYQDALAMISDAPLTGHGISAFEAVFPQYREHSGGTAVVAHPASGLLLVLAEGGVACLLCLLWLFYHYFRSCRGLSYGRGGPFRVAALVSVISFLLYCLIDVPGSRIGALFFILFLAAFAMPESKVKKPTRSRAKRWRLVGAFLLTFGSLWWVANVTGVPLHSKTAIAWHEKQIEEHDDASDFGSAIDSIDRMLAWNKLQPESYFERAALKLKIGSDLKLVDADFERARFVDPSSGLSSIEEGYLWQKIDPKRAAAAWEEGFARELENEMEIYEAVFKQAEGNSRLMQELLPLTNMGSRFRAIAFGYMPRDLFNREIAKEFAEDPGLKGYTPHERFRIVSSWMRRGDLKDVNVFLDQHFKDVEYGWWLRSLLMKESARFEDALEFARNGISVPDLPKVELGPFVVTRMAREFVVSPDNMEKGMVLLSLYLEANDLENALNVTDRMLESENAPAEVYYWRGEILYQMNDLIESWYTLRNYVNLAYVDVFTELSIVE